MAMVPSSLFIFIMFSFHLQLKAVVTLSNSSALDFSYMKSVRNAVDLPPEAEYDYIVVGGGTAGCPLAATLSEKYSVLLLERGDIPTAHPNVLSGAGLLINLAEDDDGNTPVQRFTSEDGVANARGRVLGGTSMINAGYFSRTQTDFYSSSEGVEWDMDAVDEAYEWVEDTVMTRPESFYVWQTAVKDALLEAGVGPYNGFTLEHKNGTKFSGSTFDDLGNRHGAVQLLNNGHLDNLVIAVQATVERIIFSTETWNPSATGVVYTDRNGKLHHAFVRQKGEIILSAGTIGSPQLLLLSGIGPGPDLLKLKIPLVYPQEYVGKLMADNPRNNLNLVIPFPDPPSGAQVVGITEDYLIQTVSYTISLSPDPLPFSFFGSPATANLSLASLVQKPLGPLSHGSLHLVSPTDVKIPPTVRFNYFSHPTDLAGCIAGMRKMEDLLETDALDRYKYTDINGEKGFMFLGPTLPVNRSDDKAMEAFCRDSKTTYWHYHGGCVVGKVLDGDFRVLGVDSLRVVDSSTFSVTPGTNPQATVMMLGRYMGLKILEQRN